MKKQTNFHLSLFLHYDLLATHMYFIQRKGGARGCGLEWFSGFKGFLPHSAPNKVPDGVVNGVPNLFFIHLLLNALQKVPYVVPIILICVPPPPASLPLPHLCSLILSLHFAKCALWCSHNSLVSFTYVP